MNVTLQQALAKHQSLLGANFENLGKAKRIYLSFEQGKGWGVENFTGCLGFIKNIFRYLGLYSSTQLKNIAPQIQREAGVPAALLSRINKCWRQGPVAPHVRELPRVNEPVARIVPNPEILNRIGIYVGNTLISIEQGDLTQAKVKAIVNAANNGCLGGSGVDGAIHLAAGPALVADCRNLPEVRPNVRCETGRAVITVSGNLEQQGIERVIHAVGPVYDVTNPARSDNVLRNTYVESLEVAYRNGIRTIAFPAISTGIYGFPFGGATKAAIETLEAYAHRYPDRFNEIKLLFIGDSYTNALRVFDSCAHPHAVRDDFMG